MVLERIVNIVIYAGNRLHLAVVDQAAILVVMLRVYPLAQIPDIVVGVGIVHADEKPALPFLIAIRDWQPTAMPRLTS